MKKMISICGLVCTDCPLFIAAKYDDDTLRKETVELIAKKYGKNVLPEEINCEGCLGETEKLYKYSNNCDIRKCGFEKNIETCAHCSEYVCKKLALFFEMAPEAKESLEKIKNTIQR